MNKPTNRFLALSGADVNHIPHWEHWSNPDAETYITGIDHYAKPLSARKKLLDFYPDINLPLPHNDDPIPRPDINLADKGIDNDKIAVRWGDSLTGTWQHGEALFINEEDVLKFSPIKQLDFTQYPVVENHNYSASDAELYKMFIKRFELLDVPVAAEYCADMSCFYNTAIMWPILTFGWENFLLNSEEKEFERIMDEFAQINRRVFNIFTELPTHFVLCHDDLCTTRGPVCSPRWMNKFLYPRYEEYCGMLHKANKKVFFIGDGCIDAVADNLVACGFDGLISEPYTDFKLLSKRYPHLVLAGEGDNRILSSNNKDAVYKMVESMTQTAENVPGYFYCIGNHIPWNIKPDIVKYYLDCCLKLGAK